MLETIISTYRNDFLAVMAGEKDLMLDCEAFYHELYRYFIDEMPYGVAKARTGDPDQWIYDKLIEIYG